MKKKFTMLFAALLACVGVAKAQTLITDASNLSNQKVYTVVPSNTASCGVICVKDGTESTQLYLSKNSAANIETDATNINQRFAFINVGEKSFMYSLAAQKFVADNGTGQTLVSALNNECEVKFHASTGGAKADYPLVVEVGGDYLCTTMSGSYTSYGGVVTNWNDTGDAGCMMAITEYDPTEGELALLSSAYTACEEYVVIFSVLTPARAAVQNASTTLVGAYTPTAVAALSAALTAYDAEQTSANFEVVKNEYNALVENGEKVTLVAGEQFTVKCVEDTRGYMVYSTVEGKGSEDKPYLASSNKSEHPKVTDEGVYKEWAIVAHNGKNYMYNVQNHMFISSDNVVNFTQTPTAFDFISIGDNLWEIKFENNRYLSFSPGWINNVVRTETSIDGGCKFYIEKTGVSVSEEVVSIVETSFVNEWKNANYATLDYVGGYPTSLREEIEAVSTLAGTTAFDNENASARVAFAPGYYFIKSTSADKYATYNSNDFVYAALADGEKLGAKHVMEFVQDGENMKLQVPNLGKSVVLANAEETKGGPSKIETETAVGSNWTVENQGFAKLIVKGDNQVMRTEGSGAINYWWGDTKATWYIIPVTELEISINEFASICLPFDVEVEGAQAYAVTATSADAATLAAKEDIPAGQGAILEGSGTAKLVLTTAASDWNDNLLEGTTVATEVEGKSYILANGGNGIGLYSATLADGKFTNGANKAYLPASAVANANVAMFSFERGEGTTSIEQVAADAELVIYDLAGRRVEKMEKGIYIVNGKKVIK